MAPFLATAITLSQQRRSRQRRQRVGAGRATHGGGEQTLDDYRDERANPPVSRSVGKTTETSAGAALGRVAMAASASMWVIAGGIDLSTGRRRPPTSSCLGGRAANAAYAAT